MRFTTLPQMLAYSSTVRFGRPSDDKIEIIGAFLESNSLFDLYQATIEADVIRPEHHLDLPFLTAASKHDDPDEDWKSPDERDRWELVHALAQRGTLFTGDRHYKVVAAGMPLRGLPSAVGSSRNTPKADMLLCAGEDLAVAAVRVSGTHPLLALVDGLDALAHLNKPRVTARILSEVRAQIAEGGAVTRIDEVVVLGPPEWYTENAARDQPRRSSWSNANVMHKAVEQLLEGGIRVSLLEVQGSWREGLFSIGMSSYADAPPPESEAEPESSEE